MLQALKARIRREHFLTTPLALVFNPFYIIRNGLHCAIARVAPTLKGEILDFGCGSKPYESLFTAADSYVGIDIAVSGHDHANSKVDFYYDGKTLPFPDGRFDVVVSFEVFEHVFNLPEVIAEIRRVLKPGGQVLVTVPFAWDEHEVPYDFARYTSFGIRHVFNTNGFECLQVQKTTTYVQALGQLFVAYLVQHVLPKGRILGRLAQLGVVFPLNTATLLLNALLPKRYDYFCNSVVLSRRTV
jgi:SAM-dependent methyltransferase